MAKNQSILSGYLIFFKSTFVTHIHANNNIRGNNGIFGGGAQERKNSKDLYVITSLR